MSTRIKPGAQLQAQEVEAAPRRMATWRKTMTAMERREAITAYLFISPAFLLFLIFIAGPLLGAIVLSLFQWDILTPAQFNGLGNFVKLFSDPAVGQSIVNTFVFTFWSLILHLGFGLLLALAVNRAMPAVLKYFLRTAYFFPLLMSWASAALMWKFALDPTFGFVNYYLGLLHISAPNWLLSPQWAMPALIAVDLWRTLGFTFIILLAGLQGVPPYLHEAARIDGAGIWHRFWNVTIPMLSPTLFFASVMTFIGAFQIFDPMLIMTQGGPGNATSSLVFDIYQTGFRSFQMGYASAISLVMFLVIMAVTLIQMRLSRYWVTYD
ncbi:sugar ABC transporter permease [Ktedonosporobacter rubrisoli]|uniref:Sugar ABC transporter permease n=1 Tax=Ktedonosporobacter rubrisoli TaxID=2509675 RepID=A0A4P6K0T6_KTERU|nr:sugar ABC transporter permease [Ktedonosporobacter rubrisoli]QBD81585.1 sugar ABC transporter permease [Ktedonosporobacter rubrisoli]